DPANNRISVFDTAGTYVEGHRALGGYVITPWPGGFDDRGRFYNYGVDPAASDGFGLVLVGYDETLEPADTIRIPQRTGEGNFFELRSERGRMRAGVPFSAGVTWRFVRCTPYIWFAHTGDYKLFQRTLEGDTLRVVSREFESLPVTGEDIDSAIVRLEWFTRQGGKIDRSKFPDNKPAIQNFYVDDVGRLFVVPVTTDELSYRVLDVFDQAGRYLGRIDLPFNLSGNPRSIFRRGKLWTVIRDELDVPYVVRANLGIPGSTERGRARELGGG
ncbi:MAG: hypothetical protein O7F70_02620, partial [Gemmatimonadetes bacterium]|nr:hypothetical protein [Gemmatimonadota bacterium]